MIKVLAGVTSLCLLAACSSGKPTTFVTVTVPASGTTSPSSTPAAGATGSATTRSTTAAGSATVSAHLTKLPGTCDTLLPLDPVTAATGGTPLGGTTAFVVGRPEAGIGRIAYLNCRYGITGAGAAAVPKIEIGLSLYSQASKAAARIAATVGDYTAHGATATHHTVDGQTATVLTGGAGAGYDAPLLVVASGQRTVAVTIAPAVAGGDQATKDAIALAELALKQSGG